MTSTTAAMTADTHRGTNRLIVGIVLAVITFWLFAQTTLNVAPTMREELGISESSGNTRHDLIYSTRRDTKENTATCSSPR